ncbi:MBL fold metallo-hydrolase [Chloroflexota bacterium]
MEINWLGHSCFKIKSNSATIVTDPYSPDLGYSLGELTADIVTVSHDHTGHSYVQSVSGEPQIISGPGEYEVSGVLIIGLRTLHDTSDVNKGKNTVYLMEMDEISVCHLGDLGHVLTSDQIEEMDHVDVLLLPVGGVSTIDASIATEVVRQLEPKIVVPMHYKTEVLNKELEPVDNFFKEMGFKQVTSQPKLTFTKNSLPLTTQVVLLEY